MKIDPYFRPILISALIVILLNTVFILPINGAPLFTYFIGGVIAVLLFKRELKDEFQEITAWDSTVLGLGSGSLVGAILTLIISIKLQDLDMQKFVIDTINEAMKMHSTMEFQALENLGPGFYMVIAITTIVISCLMSLFGSLAAIPFVNKGKK